ncbi:MAG: YdjY domain-containing protein [Pirellulaceae bacterium]
MQTWTAAPSFAFPIVVCLLVWSGSTEPVFSQEANAEKPRQTLVQLSAKDPIWVDMKRKMVVLDGEIVLREGALEVFACMRGTKEHESIIAVPTPSHIVHAALLAVGAKPGTVVSWDPEYQPATGPTIDVLVQWKDEAGKLQICRGKDWVRDNRSQQGMKYDWIFPGSYFWVDERDGKQIYAADGGELICVSNFRSAMMDVPVQSSDDNTNLYFEAFTERIPPEGTKVRLFLIPQRESMEKDAEKSAQDPDEGDPS